MKSNLWTKGSVFATFMVCCVVLALLSSSLATDYWVTGTGAKSGNDSAQSAEINVGIFKGSMVKRNLNSAQKFSLVLVCLRNDTKTAYTENPCMYSCGRDDAARTADIADLIYNGGSSWSQGAYCDSESIQSPSPSGGGGGGLLFSIGHSLGLLPQSTGGPVTSTPQTEPDFMNYGLWLSTVVMLGAAIVFTLVAAVFAILNTATTPVETIFGVIGLYVWNAIAMVFELLALSLWGAQFHQHLRHSVLWREELTQHWTTDGMASLGYSYWLVFVAMFLHIINMGVLWFGTHQMRPKTVHVPVERGANTANMIY